jgi:hypothetical protein
MVKTVQLLLDKVKRMLSKSLDSIAQNKPLIDFDLKEVRSVHADIAAKVRMPLYSHMHANVFVEACGYNRTHP